MSNPFIPVEVKKLIWRDNLPYCPLSRISYRSINTPSEVKQEFILKTELIQRWKDCNNGDFIIIETRFGTGLNFLLTWQQWLEVAPKTARLHFFSCDDTPLNAMDLKRIFTLWPEVAVEAAALLAEYPVLTPGFHHMTFAEGRVNLTLMLGSITTSLNQLLYCGDRELERALKIHAVDAWFLNHESVNEAELIGLMTLLSKDSTIQMGQKIFKEIPGPACRKRITPWHIPSPHTLSNKKAVIIGAGLAGCFMAYLLANRGWEVILLDSEGEMAKGASGNSQAILYPQLSAFSSPLTQFMLSAYLYATKFYSKLMPNPSLGELSGILQLAYSQKELTSQLSLQSWLTSYPELGRLIDASEASKLTGLSLTMGGLHLPLSGWLETSALCHFLTQNPNISFVPNHSINKLNYDQGSWQIDTYQAETVILANGFQANQFTQTADLPLKLIAGQLTHISSNEQTRQIKIPVCGNGHVLPEKNKQHILGATYHSLNGVPDKITNDRENIARFNCLLSTALSDKDIIGNWCGIRAVTPDYLPLVGQVADSQAFLKRFASLGSDSKRWLNTPGDYYNGLYIFAGFGSRGLTTIPLAAEWLVSIINREPVKIPQSLARALSPSRFLIKKIVRDSTNNL